MAELSVPQVDFSGLAQLPGIYKQGQADALRQQTLANLGQGGAVDATALLKSGDLSLAQLGMTMQQRQAEAERQARQDAFQREEAARAQRNADRSYGLQARASARADEGPVEKASQRAAVAKQYGLTPDMPEFKAFVLNGELPAQNTTVGAQVEQRKAAAQSLGMTPDNPGYQSFILTGKMPREDAQPLTATDKKAILEADEGVMTNKSVIGQLNEARKLSPDVHSSYFASARAKIGNNLPDWLVPDAIASPKSAAATANYDNIVLGQALSQLKSTFGAAPTEGERKILLELQASADKPDAVRQEILKRAAALAENRLKFNEQRAAELRGGSYYKPQGGAPKPQAPAAPSQGNGADTMLQHARDALAQGAPRDAVLQRLQQAGIDPSGL